MGGVLGRGGDRHPVGHIVYPYMVVSFPATIVPAFLNVVLVIFFIVFVINFVFE